MASFKKWLFESKGIRLGQDHRQAVNQLVNRIQDYPDDERYSLQVRNPYTGQNQEIPVSWKDTGQSSNAAFNLKDKVIYLKPNRYDGLHHRLSHELVHAMDPKSAWAANGYVQPTDNMDGYLRQPIEFDAHTAEMQDAIMRLVHDEISRARSYVDYETKLERIEMSIQRSLEFLRQPGPHLQGVLDKLPQSDVLLRYLNILDQNQRRQLLTRLYHTCQEALSLVNQAKEDIESVQLDDDESETGNFN